LNSAPSATPFRQRLRQCCWLAITALSLCLASPATVRAQPDGVAQADTRTDARPAAGTAPNVDQLRAEIAELRALVDGHLPSHVPLSALFEIDLQDETAVSRRVATLRERLAAQDSGAPDELTDEAARLRIERDRVRLQFLSLPMEGRHALGEQDRLRQEALALATEKQASAAALAASEQARDSALAAAGVATDDAQRATATEEARLLAHLSELAALRQSWARSNEVQLARARELLQRYAAVDGRVALAPSQADALYARIRNDLRSLRADADLALDALAAPSSVTPMVPAATAQAQAPERITMLRRQISREESELRARETEERYTAAEEIMTALRILQARRIALLPALSAPYRASVSGFTREGLNRVLSEIEHVRLIARWYPVQRLHQAHDFAAMLNNVFTAGRFGVELLALVLVLGTLLFMRRGIRDWSSRLRAWLATRVQPHSLMLRVDRLMQMFVAIAHELILVFTVYVLFDLLLQEQRGAPELAALRRLAYAYACYRLVLAFIHRVLLTAISRYRTVNLALDRKVLRSLRLVARLVLFINVYLILAQAMLGRGALYGIAQDVAFVGAFLVGWRLIGNWRSEVTQAYLKFSPAGRLAGLVRASQGRTYGLLIASAAFLFVAARGIWVWLCDVALGFEQTRKALAYLFRRQLERQSKNQAAPAAAETLPQALQAAFTEDPTAEDSLRIDHYPALDEVLAMASALREGGHGALVALAGERGAGKTSWLMALHRRAGTELPGTLHAFDTRLSGADAVCLQLCTILGCEPTTSPQRLIDVVLQQAPRMVLLDLGQNLMLRTVGGLSGYALFIHVAQATVSRVLWVVAFAYWPFEYLLRTHPDRDVYDRIIRCEPWSEQQISALIDARLEAAGFSADYDHLLLNTPSLVMARSHTPAPGQEAERIADRYHRLIWDYADGNPRIALHFFRLSLSVAGEGRVSVRLFPIPAGNALEGFELRTRFVLSCVVQHENLTDEEAAESLRFPLAECTRALQLLQQQGFLSREADLRYRVTSHWNRAVLRFLQRKRLLAV
jgi:hypothetical protein